MIRLPPADPAIKNTDPSGRVTMAGVMDDNGRFPGRMKFASDGMYPKELDEPGIEKSTGRTLVELVAKPESGGSIVAYHPFHCS